MQIDTYNIVMDGQKSQLQDLKDFITVRFAEFDKRLDKLEDGVRGNEYTPGMVQKIRKYNDELRTFKSQVDLDPDDVDMIKRIVKGARSWKLILGMTATVLGGLAGLLLWFGELIRNYSSIFGK